MLLPYGTTQAMRYVDGALPLNFHSLVPMKHQTAADRVLAFRTAVMCRVAIWRN